MSDEEVMLRNIAEFESTKDKILGFMAQQTSFDDTKRANASGSPTDEREEPMETNNFELTPSTSNNQRSLMDSNKRSSTKSAMRKNTAKIPTSRFKMEKTPSKQAVLKSIAESCNVNSSEVSHISPLKMQLEKNRKGLTLPQDQNTKTFEKALKEVHSSKISRNPNASNLTLAFRPMTSLAKTRQPATIMLKSGDIQRPQTVL